MIRPSSVAVHARDIAQRIGAIYRGASRVAYTGAHGSLNLGDEVLFEAAQALLSGDRLISYTLPSRECRLAHIGLSGKRFFKRFVLGGGTLVNAYGELIAATALAQGLPAFTLGTGVGSGGLDMREPTDLGRWPALLRDFAAVGVRGPLSKAHLDALGVSGVEVVGDAALALAAESLTIPAVPRRFAVNLTAPTGREHVEQWGDEWLAPFERASATLIDQGWTPVFVAMHENDLKPLRKLAASIGADSRAIRVTSTWAEFASQVGPCALVMAMRLHAAVLSSCLGVPALSVGYREKCLDFMASMELEYWYLPRRDVAMLEDKVRELVSVADGLRPVVLRRARAYQRRLRDYVATWGRAFSAVE